MTQSELREFFNFCAMNLLGFELREVDESQHYYLNNVLIGGYAGDRQDFFYHHSDELARAVRMMDASNLENQSIQWPIT
jgi:hypothetical protein